MSIDDLLINRCDIGKVTRDQWNRTTRTIIFVNVKCRWEWGNELVEDFRGQKKVATALIFFRRDQDIKFTYFLRHDGREYSILNIQKPQDSTAIHHKEIFVESHKKT